MEEYEKSSYRSFFLSLVLSHFLDNQPPHLWSEISVVFLEEFYSTVQENSCKSTMDFIPAGPVVFLQIPTSISQTEICRKL